MRTWGLAAVMLVGCSGVQVISFEEPDGGRATDATAPPVRLTSPLPDTPSTLDGGEPALDAAPGVDARVADAADASQAADAGDAADTAPTEWPCPGFTRWVIGPGECFYAAGGTHLGVGSNGIAQCSPSYPFGQGSACWKTSGGITQIVLYLSDGDTRAMYDGGCPTSLCP